MQEDKAPAERVELVTVAEVAAVVTEEAMVVVTVVRSENPESKLIPCEES